MTHTVIEHRNGLIVDVGCTEFNGRAEVEAALVLERTAKPGSTIGADKNYDQQRFVQRALELKVRRRMWRRSARAAPLMGAPHGILGMPPARAPLSPSA